jgi:hypothetical protein
MNQLVTQRTVADLIQEYEEKVALAPAAIAAVNDAWKARHTSRSGMF